MKVGLFGFGRAGRSVASLLLQKKEAHLSWVIRRSKVEEHRSVPQVLGIASDEPGLILSQNDWTAARLLDEHPVDVIIDFSNASSLSFYGDEAAKRDIAIVSAISEYPTEELEHLEKLSSLTRVLWSPNITVGINFLMLAARILKGIAPQTDIEVIEEHFKDKSEVSGTAKKIAQSLEVEEEDIKTIRAGGIVGRHEILFGFPHQTVRLKHESISREAFGSGALFAARNILDKPKGLYTMEDLLSPYFKELA